MAHAVFIQNPASIYDDAHGLHYHFPKQYLNMVTETVGDWVVFYQSRAGANGYTHVQRVAGVRPDPLRPDHFYADLDPASALDLEQVVPRLRADRTPYETRLPPSGGLNASAVRRLTRAEFAAIVNEGLRERPDADAHPRKGPLYEMAEDQTAFTVDRTHVLTNRIARNASFARNVRRAYGGRCAVSGLHLRNGGGRAEVEAAHIRAVADGGPDVVQNGIALSGTIHWMFDRGLIKVADDYSLLISDNKVDKPTVDRLINPERRLLIPDDPRLRPHPDYLRWHREKDYA